MGREGRAAAVGMGREGGAAVVGTGRAVGRLSRRCRRRKQSGQKDCVATLSRARIKREKFSRKILSASAQLCISCPPPSQASEPDQPEAQRDLRADPRPPSRERGEQRAAEDHCRQVAGELQRTLALKLLSFSLSRSLTLSRSLSLFLSFFSLSFSLFSLSLSFSLFLSLSLFSLSLFLSLSLALSFCSQR